MQVIIHATYKTKRGLEALFSSDFLEAEQAIVITEDLMQTGRLKHLSFVDKHDRSWNLKELKRFMEDVQTEPYHIKIYFDGGYHRKTMESGLGIVIYYEQNNKKYRLRKNALVKGLVSNNDAEYAALHLALKELEVMGVHHLDVHIIGDSMVAINQLNESWPCYEEELARWLDRIEGKIEELGIDPIFELVSRNENKEADQLASQALNGIEIESVKELSVKTD